MLRKTMESKTLSTSTLDDGEATVKARMWARASSMDKETLKIELAKLEDGVSNCTPEARRTLSSITIYVLQAYT